MALYNKRRANKLDLQSIGQKTCEHFPSLCEEFVDKWQQDATTVVVAVAVTTVALGYLLNKCCSRAASRENRNQNIERIRIENQRFREARIQLNQRITELSQEGRQILRDWLELGQVLQAELTQAGVERAQAMTELTQTVRENERAAQILRDQMQNRLQVE